MIEKNVLSVDCNEEKGYKTFQLVLLAFWCILKSLYGPDLTSKTEVI